MLIAIIGCDGSGKTTTCKNLSDILNRNNSSNSILNKWNIINSNIHPECRFISTELNELKLCISEMDGPGRAFFLFSTIALNLTQTLKISSSKNLLISDGYWMKHAASESIYGCKEEMIKGCISVFPKPDYVFFLDVHPSVALKRKGINSLNSYECGLKIPTESNFISHQIKISEMLSKWANDFGWIKVDGNLSEKTISHLILETIFSKDQLSSYNLHCD